MRATIECAGHRDPVLPFAMEPFLHQFWTKFGTNFESFLRARFGVQKMASIWGPPFAGVLFSVRGPQIVARKWTHFWGHFLAPFCIFFAKNWPPGGQAGGQACPCLWAWISKPSLRQQGIMQFLCIVRVGCLGPVLRPESGLVLMAIFWTSFWARGLDTNTALHFGARVSLSRKRTRFGARVFHRKTQQNSMHLATMVLAFVRIICRKRFPKAGGPTCSRGVALGGLGGGFKGPGGIPAVGSP